MALAIDDVLVDWWKLTSTNIPVWRLAQDGLLVANIHLPPFQPANGKDVVLRLLVEVLLERFGRVLVGDGLGAQQLSILW